METNYFATVAGTLAVLPGMLERRHGVIVNVSSDSGRAPGPHEAAYGASKAALSAFTESLSFDTEGTGRPPPRAVPRAGSPPPWAPRPSTPACRCRPRWCGEPRQQVSQLVLARMGGAKVDIDAAPIAKLAPIGRALFPTAYRKGVRKATG